MSFRFESGNALYFKFDVAFLDRVGKHDQFAPEHIWLDIMLFLATHIVPGKGCSIQVLHLHME